LKPDRPGQSSDGIDYAASAHLVPGYAGDSPHPDRAPKGDRLVVTSAAISVINHE